MKAVDGLIATIGIAALALAAVVVMRSREATRSTPELPMPSVHAPAPPDSAFPACQTEAEGMPRLRCQVAQARKEQRIRCYGQRLYYVGKTPSGKPAYYPWPAQLQCWDPGDLTPR